MAGLLTEKDVQRITPVTIVYNGEKYHYVMNTSNPYLATIEQAVAENGVDAVYMGNAFDVNAKPVADSVAVYIKGDDYRQGTVASKLTNTGLAIIRKHRDRMIAEGRFRKDTPLSEVYIGCENDKNFKYFVQENQS